jgi:hypothetical protein
MNKKIVALSFGLFIAGAANSAFAQTPAETPTPASQVEDALKAGDAEAEPPKREFVKWNHYEGKGLSVNFGMAALFDGVAYNQNDASERQIGKQDNKFFVRTVRAVLRGDIKTGTPISYFLSYEYIGFDRGADTSADEKWRLTDLGFTVPIKGVGAVNFGKIKEPIALERLGAGTQLPTMERAPIIDAVLPSRNNGIKFTGLIPSQRATYSIGWFNTGLGGGNISNGANSVTGRVTYLPIDNKEAQQLMHVGLGVRWAEAKGGKARLKARPEAFKADYVIDTGDFKAKSSTAVVPEFVYYPGPLMITAEGVYDWFKASDSGNPFFNGSYISAAYMITGERRNYNRQGAYFGKLSPKKPVDQGGPGAIEVYSRYSYADTDDGSIKGGKFDRITLGANWFATDHWRLELSYGHGKLKKSGDTGKTDFFQTRLQFEF